jgi:hypothetical protein
MGSRAHKTEALLGLDGGPKLEWPVVWAWLGLACMHAKRWGVVGVPVRLPFCTSFWLLVGLVYLVSLIVAYCSSGSEKSIHTLSSFDLQELILLHGFRSNILLLPVKVVLTSLMYYPIWKKSTSLMTFVAPEPTLIMS